MGDSETSCSSRRGAAALLGGLVLGWLTLLGCATAPPLVPDIEEGPLIEADRLFAERRYAESLDLYRAWLESHSDEAGADHAIFRQALAHLSLGAKDTQAAHSLLRRLVGEFPDSAYRPAAETMLAWRAELYRLRQQLEELKRIDLRPPDDPGS